MSRSIKQRGALSVGQLAARWGVSPNRIRRLIEADQLRGTFKVPAAGRYGAAIRIPLSVVEQAEHLWGVEDSMKQNGEESRPRRRINSSPQLKHFPELIPDDVPPAVECHEGESH